MSRVVVFGVGQFAELAHFYLTHDSPHEVVGVHRRPRLPAANEDFQGLPVVAFEELEDAFPPGDAAFFLPISFKRMNHVRAEQRADREGQGYELISYVSSKGDDVPGLRRAARTASSSRTTRSSRS